MLKTRWAEFAHASKKAYEFRLHCIVNPLKRIAELTPWFNENSIRIYQQRLRETFKEWLTGARVLDVGCGTGGLSKEFCDNFTAKFYIGADYSPGLARDAKTLYRDMNFICADVLKLPFPDNSFDIVHSSFLFHHLEPEIRQSAIMEKLRVSRRAVIIEDTFGFEPCFWCLPHKIYYTLADGSHYRYTIREWNKMFNRLNLKIIKYFHTDETMIVNRQACWVISL